MPRKKGEAKAQAQPKADRTILKAGEYVLVGPGPLDERDPGYARVTSFITASGAGKVVRYPGESRVTILFAGERPFQLSFGGARALGAAIEALENDTEGEA